MSVIVKTRTTAALYAKLSRLAKSNRRPIAEEVRIAIERHVEAPNGKEG